MRKLLPLIILGLLLVAAGLLVFFLNKEESYNQYRVANLGRYLYDQFRELRDVSEWKKRCAKCRDGAETNKELCEQCSHVFDIKENYSLHFLNKIRGLKDKKSEIVYVDDWPFFSQENYCPPSKNDFTFFKGEEKVDYDIPIQKCGGLQPCCTCWPGKPIYGLSL